jgi:hypothetical protein
MQTGQDNVVVGNTLIDGGVTDGTLLVEDIVSDETASDDAIAETLLENNAEFSPSEPYPSTSPFSEVSPLKMNSTPLQPEYNGIDRNAWIFGFNPQAELWNGRLAMIGFVAYALWDIKGYSVLRDVLHFIR